MISQSNQELQAGDYIDFKDSNGEWAVGYINSKTADTLHVRSDGWASKYDIVPSYIYPSIYRSLQTVSNHSDRSWEATQANKKNQE